MNKKIEQQIKISAFKYINPEYDGWRNILGFYDSDSNPIRTCWRHVFSDFLSSLGIPRNLSKIEEVWNLINEHIEKEIAVEETREIIIKKVTKIKKTLLEEELLYSSGIKKRFKNKDFQTFNVYDEKTKIALKKAKDYVKNYEDKEAEGKGLLITGNGNGKVGTGKTHLAVATCLSLIEKLLVEVKFGNVTSLIYELKKCFSPEAEESEGEIIEVLSNHQLIVIDDLGKEIKSDWAKNIIYTVINNRYENQKPIIVTTELDLDELAVVYGKAVPSRLYEVCEGVKLDGEDYRKKIK